MGDGQREMTLRKATAAFVLVALCGLVVAAPKAAAEELAIGAPFPAAAVEMKNVDGKMVSIGQVKGDKGVLVVFTCNPCPWAKAWEGRIVALGNEYMKRGVGVIAVNANDPAVSPEDGFEAMRQRAESKGFGFPYVVDGDSSVARAFGATRTPEAFLFDGQGKLVYHGAIDDSAQDAKGVRKPYLTDALAALLEGKPVPEAETKAMGCTIKFREGTKVAS